jgi:hypothetical protein
MLCRMPFDHPVDHPDDSSGSVWIRLDRRGIQREQARGSRWARSARKPSSSKPSRRRQASGARRPGPPAGFGCWPNSGTPVLKGEVGAELPAPLGTVDQLGG